MEIWAYDEQPLAIATTLHLRGSRMEPVHTSHRFRAASARVARGLDLRSFAS